MDVMESQYNHNWIQSSHNHSHKMIPQYNKCTKPYSLNEGNFVGSLMLEEV